MILTYLCFILLVAMISETVNYKCVLNHYPLVRAQASLIIHAR